MKKRTYAAPETERLILLLENNFLLSEKTENEGSGDDMDPIEGNC